MDDSTRGAGGLNLRHLDFSMFHPQDHTLFGQRCQSLPGGRARHLRDWWDYRFGWRPALIGSRLACRLLDRHAYRESWHAHAATPAQRAGLEYRPLYYDGRTCEWCGRRDPGPEGAAEACPEHASPD